MAQPVPPDLRDKFTLTVFKARLLRAGRILQSSTSRQDRHHCNDLVVPDEPPLELRKYANKTKYSLQFISMIYWNQLLAAKKKMTSLLKEVLRLRGVKAAIFDMDGTMVNNNLFHKRAWEEFAKRYGVSLTNKDFRRKISGKQNKQILPNILPIELSNEELSQLADEKEGIYREIYAPYVEPVEGLHELIQKLKARHIKVAVATMAEAKNRNFILGALGLADQFDAIVDEEHFKNGKPNPEIFVKCAKQLGTKPAQCIVFEDTPAGIEAARRAGMGVVGLRTFHTRDELKEADVIIDNFSQLDIEED